MPGERPAHDASYVTCAGRTLQFDWSKLQLRLSGMFPSWSLGTRAAILLLKVLQVLQVLLARFIPFVGESVTA